MAAIAVDASLVADSNQAAGAAVLFAAASAMSADSSQAGGSGVAYALAASFSGENAGNSILTADLDIFDESMISLVADSSLAGGLFVAKLSDVSILAGALMTIDPAGFIITRFGRPAPVVAPVPPVPTIRIVPPVPPKPSFVVSATPPPRREDR